MRSGDATPNHASRDADTGPVTQVDGGLVATTTPFKMGRLANVVGEITGTSRTTDAVEALALAPTPRVDVSAGLALARAFPGTRILGGRYRLGRQLGAGGYGAVFAAEDTINGERVAIKVLSPAASQNQELVIRFHREAIAASRARHPHIINIADFDVDDDDGHYIVMEHLDGRDLAQTLAEAGALAPVRALTIAAQCARGIAAAHRVGVLHRDLKPANVFLIRREAGAETVKIIDFGISKLTPLAGDYTDVTSTSKVVGTPSYMSPEQARGACLDARTDVYALGVMLFEMLVGERPFTGRSPIEIIGNHFSAPRVAPSTLRPELASCPGIDELVLRAIAPDRAQRFASMEALGDAIVACLRAFAPEAAEHVTEPTGEQTNPTKPVLTDHDATSSVSRPAPLSRWLAIAAALIAATIATIGWMSADHAPASPTRREVLAPRLPELTPAPTTATATAEATAPTPPPHRVSITSSPDGAVVYRGDSRLGVTPLTITLEPGAGAQTLTLDMAGYRRRRVVVDSDRDHVNVKLSAERPARPAARKEPIVRGVAEW